MSEIHYADDEVVLWHGDCLDVLRGLPDASMDSVVTDPPYGIGFMGKEWDSGKAFVERRAAKSNTFDHVGGNHNPTSSADAARTRRVESVKFGAWCADWTSECLRVLKPGGHMLAFGGTRTWHRLACAVEDAGFEMRDNIAWMYGSGFPKSHNLTDDAGERTGWGTALKPAFEPIVVARKPLVGTVAANVLAHGTGALNIDGCRVATGDVLTGSGSPPLKHGGMNHRPFHDTAVPRGVTQHDAGRWPANVVLDESQAEVLDDQSGILTSGANPTRRGSDKFRDAHGDFKGQGDCVAYRGAESGGASRFYYVAKAPAAERVRVGEVAHPTVKPLALMRWLVRLVTPPGGTVLEPFAGSGTTVEACIAEGFSCVAIERDETYLPLIAARIARRGVIPTTPKPAAPIEDDVEGFDFVTDFIRGRA